MGRLEREKGHALLLDAVAALLDRDVPVSLTVVGDGSEMAGDSGAGASVWGSPTGCDSSGAVGQDEIRDHYARADAFCLSSLGEGIPVVLMEAMAMRMPVIAPRIMGIPELVQEGTSGLLVAPGRADALAEAIATWPPAERWPAMGEAGRVRVAEQFEIGACAGQLDVNASARQ